MSLSGGAPRGAPPAFEPALASHVHAADLGAVTVLLDLKHDRYLAASSALLARMGEDAESDVELEKLRARLASAGVLRATDDARDWFGFVRACAWADGAVRCKRLDRATHDIRAMRRRHGADNSPRSLVRAFDAMRPWYPRRIVCLFDSLALMRFLTRHGARGELVFGVRGMPFAAHCWVEDEGAPLNDEFDYCASFQPILRV